MESVKTAEIMNIRLEPEAVNRILELNKEHQERQKEAGSIFNQVRLYFQRKPSSSKK